MSTGQFKTALGQWPSGVSVVTTRVGATPAGMTVSAFFSVSLAPPLVAVCLDRKAATLALIARSGRFAVNVLSSAQSELSDRFAMRDNEPTRFDGLALHPLEAAQSPLIAGAVAHLDCALTATHDAGDHVLCVGQVDLALTHPGRPLIYHAARYHSLAPLAGAELAPDLEPQPRGSVSHDWPPSRPEMLDVDAGSSMTRGSALEATENEGAELARQSGTRRDEP